MSEPTKCALIAIIGAPNAGKSTLVNQASGSKVTIVSPKPQTTRFRIRAVVMRPPAQLILVDTPGIFAPRRRLDRAMVAAAWGGAQDADITVLVVDAKAGLTEGVRAVIEAAGIRDVLAKSLGSSNHANVVKATLEALTQLRLREQIYKTRGIAIRSTPVASQPNP